MMIRNARKSDAEMLAQMAEASGYPYPALSDPMLEEVMVVEDGGQIVMACGAKRIIELYLWCSNNDPATKLRAIGLLHDAMGADLKAKGYAEANAFIPPQIGERFRDRLVKMFAWAPNWPSIVRRL